MLTTFHIWLGFSITWSNPKHLPVAQFAFCHRSQLLQYFSTLAVYWPPGQHPHTFNCTIFGKLAYCPHHGTCAGQFLCDLPTQEPIRISGAMVQYPRVQTVQLNLPSRAPPIEPQGLAASRCSWEMMYFYQTHSTNFQNSSAKPLTQTAIIGISRCNSLWLSTGLLLSLGNPHLYNQQHYEPAHHELWS